MPDLSLFDLTGSTAVVTGASRGIGAGIATGLAAAGADIVATATNAASLDGIEHVVAGHGRSFKGYSLDLADRASVDGFIAKVLTGTDAPDILVNNAGIIRRAPAAEHGDDLWDETIAVDLSAQFRLARAAGAGMIARRRGRIIFTASLLSFQGGINVVSYAAAKSGILGVTHALANEWAPHGITVNSIVPGYIATDNTQPLRDDAARRQAIEARIPIGRWGTPADLAGAAVFLASRASDYVTGTQLVVDGGWLSR
jgi:2-dehydro-3-deoxy-D-gluconate 5-dehydrogenase